jgi:hypothetical protein
MTAQTRHGMISVRLLLPISLVTGIWVGGWYHYEKGTRADYSEKSTSKADPIAHSILDANSIDYAEQIEPILRSRCYECHGPKLQEANLRFDRPEWLVHRFEDRALVAAGDSGQSELLNIISGRNVGVSMPPKGPRLTDDQVDLIARWIDEGAHAGNRSESESGTHWAYCPIQRPRIPEIANDHWSTGPIDRFILRKLNDHNIRPAQTVNRATLIRRMYLDLIGLPPSPEELKEDMDDQTPGADERLIERLLTSPHYGEKWARHWLDQIRYADSDGFEIDYERPNAWRFRNWVIDALNQNMPFDQFTIEQIAGDLIPNATIEQHVATGMHRCAPFNREAGTNIQQNRFEQTVNRVGTLSTVWLGLSVRCAQCHDHKFDPVSQRDYYALFAILNTTEDVEFDAPILTAVENYESLAAAYSAELTALLEQDDYQSKQTDFEQILRNVSADPDSFYPSHEYKRWLLLTTEVSNANRVLMTPASERTLQERDALLDFYLEKQFKLPELRAAVDELRRKYRGLTSASVVRELKSAPPTRLRVRGDFFQPTDVVEPAIIAAFSAAPVSAGDPRSTNRLTLANWIVDSANPLTARVIVNRIWQQFFGAGLVLSTDDFGVQGERPSHPELLDWLASEFKQSGWNVKHLQRLIVTSAAYRQSSVRRAELHEIDPMNRLLARQVRLRLPAELIRDSALKVSGLLNDSIGGRSIKPAQPNGVAELSEGGTARWKQTQTADRNKRGLYIHFQRTSPYPFLTNFDAPEMNVAACSRQPSTTPLQALNLMNDPIFFEAAVRFGNGLAQFNAPEKVRIEAAYWQCFSRPPTERECDRIQDYRKQMIEQFTANKEAAAKVCPESVPAESRIETAAWIMIARLLFNTDEFLTRE